MYFLSLFFLVVSAVIFYKRLGFAKFVLHPAFYFFLIWIVSVLSEWLLDSMGIAKMVYPQYIKELLFYVSFTSVCFTFSLFASKNKYKKSISNIDVYKIIFSNRFYIIMSCLYIVSIFLRFILYGKSFAMAVNRGYGSSGGVSAISNRNSLLEIMTSFGFILQIFSGFLFVEKTIFKKNVRIHLLWLLLPIVGGILDGDYGGRVVFDTQ